AQVFARVEELAAIGLEVPVVAEVLHGLKRKGWPIAKTVVPMDEAVELIGGLWLKARAGRWDADCGAT
ncbi:MAG: hypothetical protein QHH02_00780, partial [Syntrophomonadaceae bacterium]|nr:hypothetical protein [Syntrophomonadaceae bacterium]